MIYNDKFHLQGGELIRQVTFGMNDGVVSIFALLAGIAGAGQPPATILITLLAATIAGALSMAAGEFISGKSERDYFNHEIEQERLEIKLCPDIEREEIRKIYSDKGFSGELLERIVAKLTEKEDVWVQEMIIAELGTTEPHHELEIKPSVVIFFAFILGACFPTLPYVFLINTELSPDMMFYVSTGVTILGLFLAGALKKFVTGVNWLKSGVEMLVVGFFAYGIAYIIGCFFPEV
jgi:VIT1/CCC1 family predicted Fe2+/Mn2+ transporter